jgi:hypothetical protein
LAAAFGDGVDDVGVGERDAEAHEELVGAFAFGLVFGVFVVFVEIGVGVDGVVEGLDQAFEGFWVERLLEVGGFGGV